MAVDFEGYIPKLEKLLEKFSQPNFEIENEVYLNTLLSNLAGKENKELGESLQKIPLFTKWIYEVTIYWENNDACPSQTVGSFTINLLSLLSKDENKFVLFRRNNIYERIIKVLQIQQPNCNPSLKLGYITLLSSFLNHPCGIEYLVTTNYWQDALKYCLSNQTLYIIKEGREFMYKLLDNTVSNIQFSNMLAKEVLSALFKNHLENDTSFPEIKEEQLRIAISPTLELISYILENHFKSPNFANKNHQIPILLLKTNNLADKIWKMVLMIHNPDLLLQLEKIMIMIYFLEMHINCTENLYPREEIREAASSIFQMIRTHLSKREITSIIKLCYWIHYFWQFITPYCYRSNNEENPILFENQILVVQMMPLFCISNKPCQRKMTELMLDEFRENFVTKLFKIMCETTIRMCYTWRSIILEEDETLEYAQLAIDCLLKSRMYFKRETAVICFQAILYNLKDIAHFAAKHANNAQIEFNKYSNYVVTIIDAIILFIKDYDFTWRESLETLCIMTCCLDILSYKDWPPKAVVRTLKLLNLSITKFMAPNMALLVDKTSGTAMENLRPMFESKLNDFHWEIRDSALEVLDTIAEYSRTKFPSFQKIILSSDFPSLVTKMCITDEENYVRATAIKCLQKMIQVSAFWYPRLQQNLLPQKMMEILLNEPEGIVRCEAATLICDIYFYQSFQEDIMHDIYKIMSHAVTSDLHWEVKLNALNFWEHVIRNELKNQGMIDGTFPTVTFSKEHKKIMTLTNTEIATRLNKALTELSKCGCLGVLITAVSEDYELQVSKKALEITKILTSLLTKYNVKSGSNNVRTSSSRSSSSSSSNPCSPIQSISSPIFVSSKSTFDNDILEEVLDSKDINIIDDLMNLNPAPVSSNTYLKDLIVVSPEIFLNFIQKDLDTIITQRADWLNDIDGLNSLLDDMLKTYNYDDDINQMDCY